MADAYAKIRAAFSTEQLAAPPPAGLRAQVVAAVEARARVGRDVRQRSERGTHWLMVATAALLTIVVVAGFMAVRYATQRQGVVHPGPAPQVCLPGPTPQPASFSRAYGCITYSDGSQILAVDPFHPSNRIVIGQAPGQLPIGWSRDGRRLLLMSAGGVYVMSPDGSQTRPVTGDLYGWEASISPDGTRVVFNRFSTREVPGGHAAQHEIYSVDVAGGTPRLLASSHHPCLKPIEEGGCHPPGEGSDPSYPAWSPDGRRIAYVLYDYDARTDQIWTMNSDGSGQQMVVKAGTCEGDYPAGCTDGPAWSPNGSLIAFHHAGAIYVVHADGSGMHQLVNADSQPAWSPDGSEIAFLRSGGRLFTMAADASNVRQVQGVVVIPPYGWAWNPVATGGQE